MSQIRPVVGSEAGGGKERIRVLVCKNCETLEELPFRRPTDTGPDYYLQDLVDRHNSRFPHTETAAILFDVEKERWDSKAQRADFLKAMREGRDDLIDLETWAAQDTFKEDALKCFNRHGRPSDGCVDFWDDSKRIGRPTPEGQAFAHEYFKLAEDDPHLCSSCPVMSTVVTKIRAARGAYKETNQ